MRALGNPPVKFFSMDEILETLLPAVEEQAQAAETVYVRETLDRLVAENDDIDEVEAKNLVAFCLADELEVMDAAEPWIR